MARLLPRLSGHAAGQVSCRRHAAVWALCGICGRGVPSHNDGHARRLHLRRGASRTRDIRSDAGLDMSEFGRVVPGHSSTQRREQHQCARVGRDQPKPEQPAGLDEQKPGQPRDRVLQRSPAGCREQHYGELYVADRGVVQHHGISSGWQLPWLTADVGAQPLRARRELTADVGSTRRHCQPSSGPLAHSGHQEVRVADPAAAIAVAADLLSPRRVTDPGPVARAREAHAKFVSARERAACASLPLIMPRRAACFLAASHEAGFQDLPGRAP